MGHEFFLTLEDLSIESLPIDLGLLRLVKHLPFFFLHMMLDQLAEHGEFSFEDLITRIKFFQFGNEHMYEVMLFVGFIHEPAAGCCTAIPGRS